MPIAKTGFGGEKTSFTTRCCVLRSNTNFPGVFSPPVFVPVTEERTPCNSYPPSGPLFSSVFLIKSFERLWNSERKNPIPVLASLVKWMTNFNGYVY